MALIHPCHTHICLPGPCCLSGYLQHTTAVWSQTVEVGVWEKPATDLPGQCFDNCLLLRILPLPHSRKQTLIFGYPCVLPADANTWPTWGALRERVLTACKEVRLPTLHGTSIGLRDLSHCSRLPACSPLAYLIISSSLPFGLFNKVLQLYIFVRVSGSRDLVVRYLNE